MAGSNTKKKSTGKTAGRASSGRSSGKKTSGKRTQAAQEPSFLQSEVAILGTFAVCVFLFLSNFHICGMLGDMLSSVMLGVFGTIGYLAPILLFAGMVFYASNEGNIRAVYKMLAVEVLLIVLCGLAQLVLGGGYQEGQTLGQIYQAAGENGLGGGVIGGALVLVLHTALGTIGSYLVLFLFMIISIVCITEKSFVSVVRSGSGKAYQYAREDYDRRKEIREERREERRLLKEEQRVKGVNLASTDLSKEMPAAPAVKMPDVSAANTAAASSDEMPASLQKSGRVSPADAVMPPEAPETGNLRPSMDSADVFRGQILMPGRREEDAVPFEEDIPAIPHSPRDEDVFVTRDYKTFDEMELFPEGREFSEKPETFKLNMPEEETRAETSPSRAEVPYKGTAGEEVYRAEAPYDGISREEVLRTELPQKGIFEEEVLKTEIPCEEPQTEEIPPTEAEAPKQESFSVTEETSAPDEGYLDDDYIDDGSFPSIFDEELDTEPYVETRENWESAAGFVPEPDPSEDGMFCTEERTKTVVTASGRVIETDIEALAKKKVEKRREDAAKKAEEDGSVVHEIKKNVEKPKKPYVIPPLTLLKRGEGPANGMSEKEYKETAIKLQQTLRNFGVGVTVTNISCGPTVTRYELHPEQGVKVSKILSLSDDIKLNLAAADIRIEAPIPGKAAVGIEVPNKVNSTVYLRDLLESEEFKKHPSKLAFAVGKDIGGQTIVADLAKMPHLLIAGQTGSGKSVGINTMIMSLIYHADPEDVKLIMVDPKVVELSVYNGIPHLLIPVVTDPKKAAGALNWAVAEMTERYKKFADSNVRDLKGYNAKVKALADSGDVPADEVPSRLPQIVIIIDELADLMMVASGEVEDAICRLAQLARAAGIHLVIATQRPSVNVITGVIKANVPSRIAFSVASGTDSRTILDMNGAEKLLGNGDMLFYPSGYPKPIRVQGSFVSDSEVSAVTDFLKEQNSDGGYDTAIEAKMNQTSSGGVSGQSERDALFTDAGKFIIEKDKASIGMLQRMFKIGFNRAARIMDQLAEAGVVGEEEGTKPRKILMSMEEFEGFIEAGY